MYPCLVDASYKDSVTLGSTIFRDGRICCKNTGDAKYTYINSRSSHLEKRGGSIRITTW